MRMETCDVTDYSESEMGDLDALISAVGLDSEDDDDRATVMDDLTEDCPSEWPDVNSETLAENVEEYTTQKVVRVGDDLFYIDENGGERGAHQNYKGLVESIDETEAKRRLLSFGLSPKEVARKLR